MTFADDKSAAADLKLSVQAFRALVAEGALPGPVRIGKYERWDMPMLHAILRGKAMPGRSEDLEI